MAKMTEEEAKRYEERRQLRRAQAKRAFLTLPLNELQQANMYTTTVGVQASAPTGRKG